MQQLLVQAVKDGAEALPANALYEVADGGVVEHGVADGEETKPAVGDVFCDDGTQSPGRGDVVQGTDEQPRTITSG